LDRPFETYKKINKELLQSSTLWRVYYKAAVLDLWYLQGVPIDLKKQSPQTTHWSRKIAGDIGLFDRYLLQAQANLGIEQFKGPLQDSSGRFPLKATQEPREYRTRPQLTVVLNPRILRNKLITGSP